MADVEADLAVQIAVEPAVDEPISEVLLAEESLIKLTEVSLKSKDGSSWPHRPNCAKFILEFIFFFKNVFLFRCQNDGSFMKTVHIRLRGPVPCSSAGREERLIFINSCQLTNVRKPPIVIAAGL